LDVKILLVDDSATVRSILRVYLMGMRCEFVEAEGGERALLLARLQRPALIVADVRMPGVDGLEFLAQLRADEDPELRATPVVLLTSEKGEDVRARAMALGANAIVHKPITAPLLVETVKQLLARPAA
jgi:CheY-like chemotaxis protein